MAEKQKVKRQYPGEDYPCVVCGSKQYSWGKVAKSGGGLIPGTLIYYHRSDATNLFEQTSGVREAMARTCEVCGNIQLFVKSPWLAEKALDSDDDPLKDLFEE